MASHRQARIGGWLWAMVLLMGTIASPALAQTSPETLLQQADQLEQDMLFLFADEDYEAMVSLAEEALAIYQQVYSEAHPVVAASMNHLAGLYTTAGRYDEAEVLYWQAIALRRSLLGDDHLDLAISLEHLAQLYESQGRAIEAAALYRWGQQR